MIDGLKVTVTGKDLIELAMSRRAALAGRAARLSVFDEESGSTANQSTVQSLQRQAEEYEYVAEHLEPGESYRLSIHELNRLGIGENIF